MIGPEMVLARVFGVPASQLHDDASPDSVPTWDSLAHMTMLVELEREYGVSIAPIDAIEAKSVGAVKQMLRDYGVSW
jgi:acyl carrier protein